MIAPVVTLLDPFAATNAALPTATGIDASVLWRVFVAVGTVGLVRPMMSTVSHHIVHVLATGIPAQVFQAIVGGVGIRVVTGLFPGKGRTNKGCQDQSVNTNSSSRIAGKSDTKTTIFQNDGPQYATTNRSHFAVTTTDLTVQRSHSSSIRHLKTIFIPHHRQPVLHGVSL